MNYIVYKTTNLINGKIYVGVHRTNPDVFDGYIGCGVTYKDSKSKCKGFPKAVLKYGYKNFKRETLKIFPDTEEGRKQAFKLEEEIVNEDFIKDPNTYNLIKGGLIALGELHEIEIAQYTIDGKFIRTWNSIKSAQEALNYTSIYNAVCGRSSYCGDYQWKYYYGDDSDISPVIKKEKSVYQFDMQGNLLKCWKSASEASKQFNNPDAAKTAIGNVCNGRANQAYGYYWSFKTKFEMKTNKNYAAVAKYDDDGNFLESYTSIAEAGLKNGMPAHNNIGAAIKGTQKRCGGFRWRYFYGNTNPIEPLR